MSFIYRDILGPSRSLYNYNSAFYQKFNRLWGKKTIDGIEVYDTSIIFYTGTFRSDITFTRFLSALGMSYEKLTETDVDSEIANIYFKLGSNFEWDGDVGLGGTDTFSPTYADGVPATDALIDLLGSKFQEDDEVVIEIIYGGQLGRYIKQHSLQFEVTDVGILTGAFDSDSVKAELNKYPWYYFANSRHIPYGDASSIPYETYDGGDFGATPSYKGTPHETPVTTIGVVKVIRKFVTEEEIEVEEDGELVTKIVENITYEDIIEEDTFGTAIFALLDRGNSWEEVDVINPVDDIISTVATSYGESLQYKYTRRFKFKEVTANDQLVADCMQWLRQYSISKTFGSSMNSDDIITRSIDTFPKKLLSEFASVDNTNSLFYKGHIRTNTARQMKKADFVKLILDNIDTGYSAKKASIGEKIAAVVIVIVAIVIAVYTGGLASGLAAQIAAGAAAGSMALAIGGMILSSMGGASTGGLVKQIGAFAQILGIISMVAGIYSALTNAWAAAAQEAENAAYQEALAAGSTEIEATAIGAAAGANTLTVALQMVTTAVEGVVGQATSMVSNFSNATTSVNSVMDAFSYAIKALDFYNDVEAKKLNKEIAAYEEENKKYEDDFLNRQLTNPDALYVLEDRYMTPDMLTDMDTTMRENAKETLVPLRFDNNTNI